jgi:hypothetical protein
MTLVVRYSFLEFVTPTVFSQMYYRLMGMKIGRNVTLNSTAIADPSLIGQTRPVDLLASGNVDAAWDLLTWTQEPENLKQYLSEAGKR